MSLPSEHPDPFEELGKVPAGTEVRLTLPSGERWTGWILPRDPLSQPRTVTLKLPSGYNVGVIVPREAKLDVLPGPLWGEAKVPSSPEVNGEAEVAPPGAIFLLTTGGTIASRVDYVTGGVTPVHGRKAFETVHPGLTHGGPVVIREVFDILSEDMGPTHWVTLAEEVRRAFDQGARGVVITHGTDTLGYTASALAFQLRDLPGPVVLVGAQRSIDRPSSDGITNLQGAVRVAREADLGEVVVVMHQGPSDTLLSIHRGTRVRKMHSTRRDAFRSLNVAPLGSVQTSVVLTGNHLPKSRGPLQVELGFETRTALVWVHPGISEQTLGVLSEKVRGLVLAGTGMGHTPVALVGWVRKATELGKIVALTTQCLSGEVDPLVYSRGRELQGAGAIYLGDMMPETAFVKLAWALHRTQDPVEVARLLREDRAREFSDVRSMTEGTIE